jgi:GntR family transcriptional regulator / MocR family aminotransferase
LAPCYADEAAPPPGLMLGYANVTETQIVEGVRVLAQVMQQAST